MTSLQIDNASAWLERWRKGHGLTKEERSNFDELDDVSDLSSDWVRFLEVSSASFEDVRRQTGQLSEIWERVRESIRSSEAPDDTDASTQRRSFSWLT